MIDLTKPVFFYDDRGKNSDILQLVKPLYMDSVYCLCSAMWFDDEASTEQPILFDLISGAVLNAEWMFFLATNDVDVVSGE